jgi:hypothetical protein
MWRNLGWEGRISTCECTCHGIRAWVCDFVFNVFFLGYWMLWFFWCSSFRYEKYHSFHGGDKEARKANYTDMVRRLYFFIFNVSSVAISWGLLYFRALSVAQWRCWVPLAYFRPVLCFFLQVNKYYDLVNSYTSMVGVKVTTLVTGDWLCLFSISVVTCLPV